MLRIYSPWRAFSGLRTLFLVVLCAGAVLGAAVLPSDVAEARAGGGRSVGRRPSSPSYRQPSFSQPSTPRSEPSRPSNAYPPPAANQPPPPSGGGFLRSAAGGLAGGLLGSMLFSSLGRGGTNTGGADGGYGGGSGGGGSRGGIGIFEILIFAGIAYFGYRWWRKRQDLAGPVSAVAVNDNIVNFRMPRDGGPALSSASLPQTVVAIGAEEASDLFFRIQGAWTRRDLSSVQDILGSEIAADLNKDLQELKARHCINRLENISIRSVDVGEAWNEGGCDQVGVRFTANLLDYTVQEASNTVVEGSDSEPVKFNEDWTFARPSGGGKWQLVGIQQV